MKVIQIFGILFMFFGLALNAQTKVDTLTNTKVIKLSKLGLQPSIVITKIQNSYCTFDVSTDALIQLSDNGVPSDVINEMMRVDAQSKNAIANQKNMKDPLTKRATGIYFYNPKDSIEPLRQVDPTVVSTNKSGGLGIALAQAYTMGLAREKVKSSLSGGNSHLQIEETSPVFYFYFERSEHRTADSWFFATATSPNEFVLAKLQENSNSRVLQVGDMNAYGGTSGVSNSSKIPFDYVKVSDGIYKVTFKESLKPGEYCFLYANATPTSFSNDKVFDFGIPKVEKPLWYKKNKP
ncbi:MAG: hypothetical protein JNN28_11775 [Saprospiraceae bacterium]|nr:hypothetical protein [Saprospiraceae bacterium]